MTKELIAIEDRRDVYKAIKDWREKFSNGAEEISGLGQNTFWHSRLSLWGHFQSWNRDDGSRRYWNTFGFVPTALRKNIVVEINPPDGARGNNMQGIFARAKNGSRWVLHAGRMSIPRAHISEDRFDKESSSQRVAVRFSDGTVVGYHTVANIDANADQVLNQLSSFVRECHRIRLAYSFGAKVAAQESNVVKVESSLPELTGSYVVGAQIAKIATRKHGKVWHALVAGLNDLGVNHTNSRVGRWGPDLRTVGHKPVLFEIKVTPSASDLQRAVGQLLLYESLLKVAHRKVIVLPEALNDELALSTRELDLDVLVFKNKAAAYYFERSELKKIAT